MTLFIGHRGAGKTSLLNEISGIDLDAEVERLNGASISELFARGEAEFRQMETRALEQIPDSAVVAIGAGFSGPIPKGARVVWVRRLTDARGRCFLNRPRLNALVSPLEEYLQRFQDREQRYAEWATDELFLPEGYDGGLVADFLGAARKIDGDVTVLPENMTAPREFFARRSARRWELRDDLLTEEQVAEAVRLLPPEKILMAPWALEKGEPPDNADTVSLHERAENMGATLERLNSYSHRSLKLAVEIKDFVELKAGHQWWLENPSRRSFLPRSSDGRWRWYRSLFGPQMPIHFVREGNGSSLDQPLWWQTVVQPPLKKYFGAVLGHPVDHSRTPFEHRHFDREIPFVSIAVREEEFSFALNFLAQLGLRYAAVTAPLKKLAWAHAHHVSPAARETQSANSLYMDSGTVTAHNTDILGLRDWSADLPSTQNVWLWGGGGIKSSVKAVWPQAREISARRGVVDGNPELVLWASGHRGAVPPSSARPQLIADLNYTDDSPGLEWAVSAGLPYQSGLKMFKLQAEYQRQFWRGM